MKKAAKAEAGANMREITYKEFRELTRTADGMFSYHCLGWTLTCDPFVYLALHDKEGFAARYGND